MLKQIFGITVSVILLGSVISFASDDIEVCSGDSVTCTPKSCLETCLRESDEPLDCAEACNLKAEAPAVEKQILLSSK